MRQHRPIWLRRGLLQVSLWGALPTFQSRPLPGWLLIGLVILLALPALWPAFRGSMRTMASYGTA